MKSKERGVSLPPQTRMSPLTKALIEEIGELDRTSMHLIDSFRNKANSSAHSKRRKEYANSSQKYLDSSQITPRNGSSSRPINVQKQTPKINKEDRIILKNDQPFNAEIMSIQGITEESLDDWIAQSANRNIYSYLDPWKQFKAPSSLLSQLKQRYQGKTRQNSPETKKQIGKKNLYFADNSKVVKKVESFTNQQPKQKKKDFLNITFDHNNLNPNQLPGISIRVRELRDSKRYSFDKSSEMQSYFKPPNSYNQAEITFPSSPDKSQKKIKNQGGQSGKLDGNLDYLNEDTYNPQFSQTTKFQYPKSLNFEKRDTKNNSSLERMIKNEKNNLNDGNTPSKYRLSLKEIEENMKKRSKSLSYQVNKIKLSPNGRGEQTSKLTQLQQKYQAQQFNIFSYQKSSQNQSFLSPSPVNQVSEIPQSFVDPPKNQNLENLINNDEANTTANELKNHLKTQEFKKGSEETAPILEKEQIKKISEKVEKLLAEKEEKFLEEINKEEGGGGGGGNSNLPEVNYNQNMELILEQIKGNKVQQDSTTACYLKGVGRMNKNKDKNAAAAFKQALAFDKTHFHSVYTLACLYERNKLFKLAEQWLDIANLFRRNKFEIQYGQALLYYKTLRFEDSFKKIEQLNSELLKEEPQINEDGEEQQLVPQTHLYLRSLCAKKMAQKVAENQRQIELAKNKNIINTDIKDYEIYLPLERPKKLQNESSVQFPETLLSQEEYYNKASNDYRAFVQYTCPKNFNLLKNFMFAMVFKKLRKMEIKFPPHIFCEFYTLVNQILAAGSYIPAFLPLLKDDIKIQRNLKEKFNSRRNQETRQKNSFPINSLDNQKKSLFINKLQTLSFFKRFDRSFLEKISEILELKYIEKTELLFAKKGEVFIITGGHLTVFDHSKQFNEPDIVAYYKEGDIIGCEDKDNKISFNPDIWFLSITKVEYLCLPENDFNQLWNSQNLLQAKQKLTFIKSIDIFEGTSPLLLYRLAFELLQEKTFQKGDIVYNDGESVYKYNYIELYKQDPKALKNLKNRISNKIGILPFTQQTISGFYLLQEGQLELNTINNWQSYTLKPFNYIGENLLFPTLSIGRFGKIICSTPVAKCHFLSLYDFDNISSLDKEVMRLNLQKSEYFANCQKILYKFYRFHKIDNFDVPLPFLSVEEKN